MSLYNPLDAPIKDANNGLNVQNKTVKLGSSLIEDTTVDGQYLLDLKSDLSNYIGGPSDTDVGFRIGEDVDGGEIGTSLYALHNPTYNRAVVQVGIDPSSGNDAYIRNVVADENIGIVNLGLITTSQLRLTTNLDAQVQLGHANSGGVGNKTLFISQTDESNYTDNDNGAGLLYRGGGFFTSTEIEANFIYSGLLFNSLVPKKYVDDTISSSVVSGAIVEQTYTIGTTVTVNNDTTILYVNPASTQATLTITLSAAPINGQEVKISFGGTLTAGTVITSLTIQGNTGHTVLAGSSITTAIAGDGYIFKFQSSANLWRVF